MSKPQQESARVPKRTVEGLVGFRGFDLTAPPSSFWSEVGGGIAYEGALRLFPWSVDSPLTSYRHWNSRTGWHSWYGPLAPEWDSFGEDAFGVQYLISRDDEPVVAIFWAETGEVEHLGVGPGDFLRMVREDPEETISMVLYRACVARYGELPPRQHFAMRVEAALGGKFDVENIVPMDALEHMRALSQIALQIHSVPIGTTLELK